MQADVVDKLYENSKALDDFLLDKQEITLKIYVDDNLRKNILLASASYFENEIISAILKFGRRVANEDARLVTFLERKALTRQYHTMFSWDTNNCNAFLGLFGEDFRKSFNAEKDRDGDLENAVKAFMEIGRERNRMVHQDFGQYSLEKTSAEIINLHKAAKKFLESINFLLG